MKSHPAPPAIYVFLHKDSQPGRAVRDGAVNAPRDHRLAYAVVPASRSAMNPVLEKDSVGAIAWLSLDDPTAVRKFKIPFINVGNSFGPPEGIGNYLSDDVGSPNRT